ncbi:hypothetical protein [Streptomyces sp. R41]|uniref:Immunity protein 52 domain-containing protein n=1 Tax=Streptomyces sp. R41 TaxID=3238632 RepID=A0AB39R8E1_9ACTN
MTDLPVSHAAITRLITYPFPPGQSSRYGIGSVQQATAALQQPADIAQMLSAAAATTLGIVIFRQPAADELRDPEVSAKMLDINRATLDRWSSGLTNSERITEIMPKPVKGHWEWTGAGYIFHPDLPRGGPDPGPDPDHPEYGEYGIEGVIASGAQCITVAETLEDGPLQTVINDVGARLIEFGTPRLGT